MELIRNNRILVYAALFTAVLIIYTAALNNSLTINEDGAIYSSMGRSIAQDKSFLRLGSLFDRQNNYYPVFYPLLLAVPSAIVPGNYFILRLVSVIAALSLVIVLARFRADFFKNGTLGLLAVAIFAFSPQSAFYSREIISESAFTLFLIISLFFLARYQRSKRVFNRYFFLSFLAIACACHTRVIGIALILSAVLFFLLKKDIKKSLASLLFSLVAAPWVINNAIFGSSVYAQSFIFHTKSPAVFLNRWFYNLAATVGKELPDLFFYPWLSAIDPREPVFVLKSAIGCLLLAALIYGFYLKRRKEGIGIIDVHALIYILVFYLSWTHHGARYLFPIAIFMTYYLLWAVHAVCAGRAIFKYAVTLLIVLNISGNIILINNAWSHPLKPEEKTFLAAVDWLKGNAALDRVILSRRPNWISEYARGFKGFRLLATTDIKKQLDFIAGNNIDYLVIDQCKIYRDTARDYLIPVVNAYPDKFVRVFISNEDPVTVIYRVVK